MGSACVMSSECDLGSKGGLGCACCMESACGQGYM